MSKTRTWPALNIAAIFLLVAGIVGCVVGAIIDGPGFFRAWLCAYVFWLGVPLAGITLVLVHDLSGGAWMATARPMLNAAIATMPIASLAGIPAVLGLRSLYSWSRAPLHHGNAFYLNPTDFFIRFAVYLLLWNLLAAFALWGPRTRGGSISPSLSWLSGLGLIGLAFSTGFASIDWILSLEPHFWSSAFPYGAAAGWFNTGLALILLTVAVVPGDDRERMADLAKILFATTIFWAYIEFIQFLIIWEEDLKSEIPWYVKRIDSVWRPELDVAIVFGFSIPFFLFLWGPTKRNRVIVAVACAFVLIGGLADKWWLVLPEFHMGGFSWLEPAAICALGGAIVLIFTWACRYAHLIASQGAPVRTTSHG